MAAQEALIASQQQELVHSRKIFDRASAAARIGVWECELPSCELRWTDVVYDLFDLPRDTVVTRGTTLPFYTEASRAELERIRAEAIIERGGFELDAEILTAKGRRRWLRITASVEREDGVPVRIFGMKQDITEEKLLAERLRYLAEFDVVTGLANRRQFQARFDAFTAPAAEAPGEAALLLVDLDAFKTVNDTFGHALGDEGLREAAARLRHVFADAELIARIGGDEFAVLLRCAAGRPGIELLAATFVASLDQPVERLGRCFRLGASVGIAYAGGLSDGEDLFTAADAALYDAKAAGRNTFRVFVPNPPLRGRDWRAA